MSDRKGQIASQSLHCGGRRVKCSIRLREVAHARSGDKGNSANIGVIAYSRDGYQYLLRELTAERVADFLRPLGATQVLRYELPNLGALNFVCLGILGGGGSLSLRSDAQGKTLGQTLLELPLEIPADLLSKCTRGVP